MNNVFNDAEWALDYEECGVDELWVYKFDHDPISDGTWRSLNAGTTTSYRIIDKRIQMLGLNASDSPFPELFSKFRGLQPLYQDGTLEVVIRKRDGHLWISERDAETKVMVDEISTQGLRSAYDRLSSMPNRWQ